MAKKKNIELHSRKLRFTREGETYSLLSFDPGRMVLRCLVENEKKEKREIDLPFAHLPKDLKQIIKPL